MIDALGIAILNRPDLLMRCLKSIDHPIGYLIIINNGSLDSVPVMVDRIVNQNPNLSEHSVLNPGRNIGCAGAWNMIQHHVFSDSTRNNVLICGNDIHWMPGDLQLFDNTVRDYPQADFVFGNHSYSNFLVKRSGWEKVGAFDENMYPAYLEDSSHWQTIIRTQAKAIHVAGLNAKHEGSATVNSDPSLKIAVTAAHDKNWDYYSKRYGCPKWSHAQEVFEHPFNDPSWPANKWVLSEERKKGIHYFSQWPLA